MRLLLAAALLMLASSCARGVSDSAVIDGLRPFVDRAAEECGYRGPDECVLAVRDLVAAYDRAAGPR